LLRYSPKCLQDIFTDRCDYIDNNLRSSFASETNQYSSFQMRVVKAFQSQLSPSDHTTSLNNVNAKKLRESYRRHRIATEAGKYFLTFVPKKFTAFCVMTTVAAG
jgi:hypothetical protein